jgi:hypothetical protein
MVVDFDFMSNDRREAKPLEKLCKGVSRQAMQALPAMK